MGQSATTVTAPATAVNSGTSVVIKGTVMGMSPATTTSSHYATGQAVPCVSDESMSTWMEYLYLQAPINGIWGNETITGVPVSIDAVDPNGNFVHIATVTSGGARGTFAYTWTPQLQATIRLWQPSQAMIHTEAH